MERDEALRSLSRSQEATTRSGGQIMLLRGEAGVGKTAVIDRFLTSLDRRTSVLRGWCDPLTTPRPLGPLSDMFSDAPGAQAHELRLAIDSNDIEGVYTTLLKLLRDKHAHVCVIEDAHWADGATLDLLRFLTRRIQGLPLLLVISHRDDEISDQHPLSTLLGDLATSPAVRRIVLMPLSAAAVTRLCAGTGVNAQALHRLTAGNPFYVTEILAARPTMGIDSVLPESISDAVRGRLARLSDTARETAYAVAVCGPRTPLGLLDEVCVTASRGLPECLAAGVLVADVDTVSFRHELARRAALDLMSSLRRQGLHQRALSTLARSPVRPDDLSALVFHAHQVSDREAVVRYGAAAAERASSLGAHREAAELYSLTLSFAESAPNDRRVAWLERHAQSSYLSGAPIDSLHSFRSAVALRDDMGDRLRHGDNLRWISHILWPMGRIREPLVAGLAAVHILEELGPSPELAWSLLNMAELSAFNYHENYDIRCAEFAYRAIELGLQCGDDIVAARARCVLAMVGVMTGDIDWLQAETAWGELIATGSTHAGIVGAAMCWLAAQHHQISRAEKYIAQTEAFCAEHRLDVY